MGQGRVHIRIQRELAGIVDGISLRLLVPGVTYNLPDTLARYLLETRDATDGIATDAVPAPTSDSEPYDDPSLNDAILTGGVSVTLADRKLSST